MIFIINKIANIRTFCFNALVTLTLPNARDLCHSFERKNLAQHGVLKANSVIIVSGFRPELVSGSET